MQLRTYVIGINENGDACKKVNKSFWGRPLKHGVKVRLVSRVKEIPGNGF